MNSDLRFEITVIFNLDESIYFDIMLGHFHAEVVERI